MESKGKRRIWIYVTFVITLILFGIQYYNSAQVADATSPEALQRAHEKLDQMAKSNQANLKKLTIESKAGATPPPAAILTKKEKSLTEVSANTGIAEIKYLSEPQVIPSRSDPPKQVADAVKATRAGLPPEPSTLLECEQEAKSLEYLYLQGPHVDEKWHYLRIKCGLDFYESPGSESLADVSRKVLKTPVPWSYIWSLNPHIQDPYHLKKGDLISFLPNEIDTSEPTFYLVKSDNNETLQDIQRKIGSIRLSKLKKLNPSIPEDTRLPAGTRIKVYGHDR